MRPAPETLPQLGGLDNAEVDTALVRLADHMLIAGNRGETTGYARWTSLRLRADGLILLGEWPDLDRIASATGLQTLIAALAEDAEDAEDRTALRRTAGAVGRLEAAVPPAMVAEIVGRLDDSAAPEEAPPMKSAAEVIRRLGAAGLRSAAIGIGSQLLRGALGLP